MQAWVDRETALAALRVRPQTLYAYVSRGRVAARPNPADPRRSQYSGADVAALAARRGRDRRPAAVAEGAISFGEPVTASTLSTVRQGRLVYRGRDAAALAAEGTLEAAAALLWEAQEAGFPPAPATEDTPYMALARLAAGARPSAGRAPAKLRADAAAAVAVLGAALGAPGAGPLHGRLAAGLGADAAGAGRLRRALVLLADHELNPSTFAVRVAASTGASMAACLLAGLCALSGPRHGTAGAAVLSLLAEAERTGAEAAVSAAMARGEPPPGFGHPLYPAGDPRAAALLEDGAPDATAAAVLAAVAEHADLPPNVDFALAVLTRDLGLADDAPFRMFALGRSVGWAAHAMEQAASGRLIRPRARYEGL